MPRHATTTLVTAIAVVLIGGGCQGGGNASPRLIDSLVGARPRDFDAQSVPLPFLWEPASGGPPLHDRSSRRLPDGERGLSVLSYNMEHRDRPGELEIMADNLGALENVPDIVLCQEVLFKRPSHRGPADTAAVLAEELGYHARGTKRTSDREGLAILSRYPFAYYAEKHLKARTSALLLDFARVSVMGEFLIPQIGRVRVVNVHFAYQGWEHHVRRKQLRETLDWIAERERQVPADVTILGGDFNMTPGRYELAELRSGRHGFFDGNSTRPTRGAAGNPSKRIDYIFVAAPQRHVRLVRERLLFTDGLWRKDGSGRFWPSDHVPLLHVYAFSPAALAGGAAAR